MTLNQVIARIKYLALAHRQVRSFTTGMTSDLFTDKTKKYPACCLQYNAGSISISGGATTINFRMFLVDLVHVSENAKDNQDEVLSDMLSILMDLIAEMNNSSYDDWRLSIDNSIEGIYEEEGDLYAGWFIDFSIRTIFSQNRCQVPTSEIDYSPIDSDMKLVYDKEYVATGSEGSSLTIAELTGKKIVLIIRENAPLHKVSSNPDPAEYTWDNTVISLGTPVNAGARFLILYRNY